MNLSRRELLGAPALALPGLLLARAARAELHLDITQGNVKQIGRAHV